MVIFSQVARCFFMTRSVFHLLILNKHSGSYFILYFILIVISYNEALFLSCHCQFNDTQYLCIARVHVSSSSYTPRCHVMRAGVFLYSTSLCQCTTVFCGPKRDRTDDLLNANQALSQLSYGPILSLGRLIALWWARVDLNHRPHAYQACALTS